MFGSLLAAWLLLHALPRCCLLSTPLSASAGHTCLSCAPGARCTTDSRLRTSSRLMSVHQPKSARQRSSHRSADAPTTLENGPHSSLRHSSSTNTIENIHEGDGNITNNQRIFNFIWEVVPHGPLPKAPADWFNTWRAIGLTIALAIAFSTTFHMAGSAIHYWTGTNGSSALVSQLTRCLPES